VRGSTGARNAEWRTSPGRARHTEQEALRRRVQPPADIARLRRLNTAKPALTTAQHPNPPISHPDPLHRLTPRHSPPTPAPSAATWSSPASTTASTAAQHPLDSPHPPVPSTGQRRVSQNRQALQMRWFAACIYVVLGVALTIAVSWALALTISAAPTPTRRAIESRLALPPPHDALPVLVLHSVTLGSDLILIKFDRSAASRPQSELPSWSRLPDRAVARLEAPNAGRSAAQYLFIWEEARGWPFRAMRWLADPHASSSGIEQGVALKPLIDATGTILPYQTQAIPTGVIPLGFLLDTAFWACAAAAVHRGLALLRSTLRAQSGRCTACGYVLRAGSTCPECGVAARKRSG
jgi:hypothetical protein